MYPEPQQLCHQEGPVRFPHLCTGLQGLQGDEGRPAIRGQQEGRCLECDGYGHELRMERGDVGPVGFIRRPRALCYQGICESEDRGVGCDQGRCRILCNRRLRISCDLRRSTFRTSEETGQTDIRGFRLHR